MWKKHKTLIPISISIVVKGIGLGFSRAPFIPSLPEPVPKWDWLRLPVRTKCSVCSSSLQGIRYCAFWCQVQSQSADLICEPVYKKVFEGEMLHYEQSSLGVQALGRSPGL